MKIKKQHRKKKFHVNLNRKRMRDKQRNAGDISCKIVKESWDNHKSVIRNLKEMGLANDPNKVIKIPNFKTEQTKGVRGIEVEEVEEEVTAIEASIKKEVVRKLEEEAKAPRERRFMLPKGQVDFICYLLDKYGHDYKAMAQDKKNYNQATWKQIRAKVKTFMGIPKQYSQYLLARGLLEQEHDEEELKKQAMALVMDDSD